MGPPPGIAVSEAHGEKPQTWAELKEKVEHYLRKEDGEATTKHT